MKHLLNYLLIPLLILNFISFDFLNNDLKSNVDKANINYQNQATENYSEYSENSISSQQFIDDLESVPEGGTYELQANVDFSNSENDDVTGIELNNISIYGNGYTLYNRDITEIFNTDTFEVSEEHDGLGYYSFFTEVNGCYINNLNFDNFMLPFGVVTEPRLTDVNIYNLDYQNLTFNVVSANILDDYEYQLEEINVNVSTIGLIFQEINAVGPSYLYNCCFENINFSNNTIILFDHNISTVVSPIGGIQILNDMVGEYSSIYFDNIYVNNITFSNNQFISGIINDNLYLEDENQQKYFSIFYNPFIGSATNDFLMDGQFHSYTSWNQIVFNNINIYQNSNDFANYTFYSILPSISTGVNFEGKYVYGFNLNIDFQSQIDNGENIGLGTLSEAGFYYNEHYDDDFDRYSGIYQLDLNWLTEVEVYYQYIAMGCFSTYQAMMSKVYSDTGAKNYYNEWYYDRLNFDQDYSFVLADKPTITYQNYDFYNNYDESIYINFHFIDNIHYDGYGDNTEKYFSNYTVNLINKDNNEIIWSGYAEYAPYSFEILFDDDYNLLIENNLYFEISNDYHTWEQDVNLRKYLPEVYNVSSIVENNNLTVSYDFIDPYSLINSVNISLYGDLNNLIERETISYSGLQNNYYSNSEQIVFETKIDDPNKYYLKFEVNCNIYRYGPQNIIISTLRDDLIQYDQNSDIEFRTQSILPDNDKFIAVWLIILIVIIALLLILIFIFLIYYFIIKNKKKI